MQELMPERQNIQTIVSIFGGSISLYYFLKNFVHYYKIMKEHSSFHESVQKEKINYDKFMKDSSLSEKVFIRGFHPTKFPQKCFEEVLSDIKKQDRTEFFARSEVDDEMKGVAGQGGIQYNIDVRIINSSSFITNSVVYSYRDFKKINSNKSLKSITYALYGILSYEKIKKRFDFKLHAIGESHYQMRVIWKYHYYLIFSRAAAFSIPVGAFATILYHNTSTLHKYYSSLHSTLISLYQRWTAPTSANSSETSGPK